MHAAARARSATWGMRPSWHVPSPLVPWRLAIKRDNIWSYCTYLCPTMLKSGLRWMVRGLRAFVKPPSTEVRIYGSYINYRNNST